jgi:hypothetical protein
LQRDVRTELGLLGSRDRAVAVLCEYGIESLFANDVELLLVKKAHFCNGILLRVYLD